MNNPQHVQKWGNSTGVRLPKKVLQAAKWQHDQAVSIDVHGSAITLRPVRPAKSTSPTLAQLLKGVTPEKAGGELDWGVDRGREIIDG